MKKCLSFTWFITALIFSLTACTSTPSILTQQASPTIEAILPTPIESALAPKTSTPTSLADTSAPHTISFETAEGATVSGELYGTGETAVIFSVMGNCKPGWREFAQVTAENGFMALTYLWHGCKMNSADEMLIQKFLEDTRAAITFVRKQGAKKIILVGASLGGCASAKLAVESQASGIVVLAAPPSIPQWGFEIETKDLNTNIPKLFITAENDDTVPAKATHALYDLAAEPKEWQTYPGLAHGTDLFGTESGEEIQQRILKFILAIASTK